MKTISAADADRHFSKLLRDVKAGHTVVVTSRGEPVARIEPARPEDSEIQARERAWIDLKAHYATLTPMNIEITWARDDVYDDDF